MGNTSHYMYVAHFQNLVIADLMRQYHNNGKRPPLFYWRKSNGTGTDCLVERQNNKVLAIEIEAGQTFTKDYLKNLKRFPVKETENWRIYAGKKNAGGFFYRNKNAVEL